VLKLGEVNAHRVFPTGIDPRVNFRMGCTLVPIKAHRLSEATSVGRSQRHNCLFNRDGNRKEMIEKGYVMTSGPIRFANSIALLFLRWILYQTVRFSGYSMDEAGPDQWLLIFENVDDNSTMGFRPTRTSQ
jgi:hypothetical protein